MSVISLRKERLSRFADRANLAHAKATEAAGKAVEYAIHAGQALLDAKAALPHGEWLRWLEANVTFSPRHASRYMRLAKLYPSLSLEIRTRVSDLSLREAIKAVSESNPLSVMGSSAGEDWFSPADIISRAVTVLGGIDLDPCWHPDAIVPARKKWTRDQDGLSKIWKAKSLFLNPPYGKAVGVWTEKLASEYEAGNVGQAIALLPARVDAQWFAKLDAYPRVFIRGRLKFYNSDISAPFPSAVIYLGNRNRRFVSIYSNVGSAFSLMR